MSTFGTAEKVSGHIEINTLDKQRESEIKSLSNQKGIKRPTFEWNDRSYQAFKDIVATIVPMNGKDSYYNGWGFCRPVMSNKGTGFENPGFMEKADLRQGKITHLIFNMVRLKAREYNEDGNLRVKLRNILHMKCNIRVKIG